VRALSAAILGTPEKIRFIEASNVAEFLKSDQIDVVARRITWELRREGSLPILFGPITFYDGQGFLVAKRVNAKSPRNLADVPLCVAGGTNFEFEVTSYFQTRKRPLKKVVLESASDFSAVASALSSGRCRAHTADVSELGAIRGPITGAREWTLL